MIDQGMIAATSRGSVGVCTLLLGAVMSLGCATITTCREEMVLSREAVQLPPRQEPGPGRIGAAGWVEDGAIAVQLFEERTAVSETVEQQTVRIRTVREPDSWLYFAADLSAAAGAAALALVMQHKIDACDRFEDDFPCRFSGQVVQTPAIAFSIGFGIAAVVELARTVDTQRTVSRLTPPVASTRKGVRSAMPAGRGVTIVWSDRRLDGVTDQEGVARFRFDGDRLPDGDFRIRVEFEEHVLPDVEIRRLGRGGGI